MKLWLLVFLGSGLGGVARFGVGKLVLFWWKAAFPLPTLVINVLACILLGMFAGILKHKLAYQTEVQYLLMVGFCGGFSTFSTFSLETFRLFESGAYLTILAYIFASIVICFLGIFWGFKIIDYFWLSK